jgi:PIN domain nuclease of toxin-antitoxin system
VRLLLDSQVFLWWRTADPRLTRPIVDAVLGATVVYVSAATAWELGLKVALGKLRIPEPIEDGVADSGFLELPVAFRHTKAAAALPPVHRDPFDRMLVAQAQQEGLTLVTHDEVLTAYGIALLRVP